MPLVCSMPRTNQPKFNYERIRTGLLNTEKALWGGALWLEGIGLILLVGTGEWLTFLGGDADFISISALRTFHALAGLMLATGLLYRSGVLLTKLLRRLMVFKRIPLGDVIALFKPLRHPRGMIIFGFWFSLFLVVLTGVERYVQLRYGGGVLPLLSPVAWYALHRLILNYLYVFLVLLALNWVKINYVKIKDYLTAP